jgi:hypothetical protein
VHQYVHQTAVSMKLNSFLERTAEFWPSTLHESEIIKIILKLVKRIWSVILDRILKIYADRLILAGKCSSAYALARRNTIHSSPFVAIAYLDPS